MNLSGRSEPDNWLSPLPSSEKESPTFFLNISTVDFALLEVEFLNPGAWRLLGTLGGADSLNT